MSLIHVIGIGSPFGEDTLGWKVIDELQMHRHLIKWNTSDLQLIKSDRPGIRLLELMQDTQHVFLVDAAKTGSPIGTIHCLKNKEINAYEDNLSTHDIGISQTLKIGEALNELPQSITLYVIEIGHHDLHYPLSASVQLGIQKLTAQLIEQINTYSL